MRVVCRMGREILDLAALAVRPGVRCEEIDTLVHEACMKRKCYPSPLNYRKFPKSVCTSVNEVGVLADPVSTLHHAQSAPWARYRPMHPLMSPFVLLRRSFVTAYRTHTN